MSDHNTVQNQDTSPVTPENAVDARILTAIDANQMVAEILIEPPEHGGKDVTEEEIRAALAHEKITYGIDEQAIQKLALPTYDTKIVVAKGTPAQDGVNGVCTEKFSRVTEKQFKTREDDSVNYRELGIINDVKAGTVVCECTAPTKGVDGTTVQGKTIRARDGVKAISPVGENIKTSEDGLVSEAAVTGNLVFRNNRFVIDTVYRVENVDYDIGNITFSGDVQVNGDVSDGFEIHAGGTVTLRGQVGTAIIEGENIIIEKGINGNGKAILTAKKDLKAGFIENCNIFVGEKITAEYLMHCQVECEGDIDVSVGKGIICGGKITSFGSVNAKVIGNESHTLTTLTLGVTPKIQKERSKLKETLATVTSHVDEMHKNMSYIERLVADGKPVPPDRIQFLQRYKIQMPLSEKKKNHIQQQIDELDAIIKDVSHSYLIGSIIYPPTKIMFGSHLATVNDTKTKCRVYRNSEGDITFGKA